MTLSGRLGASRPRRERVHSDRGLGNEIGVEGWGKSEVPRWLWTRRNEMGEGTASRTRAGVGHGRWRGVGNAATPRPVHVVMRGIEFPDGEELSAHRSRDQRICHIYATPRPSPHEQGRGSRFVAHTSTLTFAATMKIVSPDQLPLYVLTASDGTTEFSIRDWSLWDRDPESRAGTHRGLRQTERSLLERCRLGPGPSRVRPAISLPPPPKPVRDRG